MKLLHVEDNLSNLTLVGDLLAEQSQPNLFTVFHRFGPNRPTSTWTGLGLTLSKRFVKAIGGKIGVENRSGVISTFLIDLPRPNPASVQTKTSGL